MTEPERRPAFYAARAVIRPGTAEPPFDGPRTLRPETERASHYFHAWLPDQFEAVLHFDETRAVEPLERTGEWERGEPPETYPFGV